MLTVEIGLDKAGKITEEVEIYLDDEGLDYLIGQLETLRKGATTEHLHLMTESWGWGGLTEERQNPESLLANHLKILYRPGV